MRLVSPVKRDAYAEILAKHNEIVKRGEHPGSGHLLGRRDAASGSELNVATPGILLGNTPTITPAVALDEDGQDISTEPNLTSLNF